MAERIRVLVADDSDDTRELVKQLISLSDSLELAGEARSGLEVLEVLKTGLPDVVLMDINMPGLNGLEATERISRIYPTLVVVIMSVQGETEYLRKAMMSGAREYLIKPFNLEILEETLQATVDKERSRQQALMQSAEQKELLGKARVHAFFSTKGGVGKSVLALNTALALAQLNQGRVVVADFDLQFGDLGILSDLNASRTISEAVDDSALADPELLKGYLQKVGSVDLLLAPKKPEMAEYLTEHHIQTVLETLKKMYRFVVVDTGVSFSEINLTILDMADRIHLVSTMDLLSLKNARLGLEVLRSLHHLDKLNLVVNRCGKGSDITPADIEKALMVKPAVLVPEEDRLLLDSVNHGVPVALEKKNRGTKFYKALEQLSKEITSI